MIHTTRRSMDALLVLVLAASGLNGQTRAADSQDGGQALVPYSATRDVLHARADGGGTQRSRGAWQATAENLRGSFKTELL